MEDRPETQDSDQPGGDRRQDGEDSVEDDPAEEANVEESSDQDQAEGPEDRVEDPLLPDGDTALLAGFLENLLRLFFGK